jgi:hypothetical protein
VSSEEEKGSIFTIVLPYNSDATPPAVNINTEGQKALTE